MIEFLSTAVDTPRWAVLVALPILVLLAGAAGWFWGRSAVAEVRQRAEAAEREARFQSRLAASRQPATEALTRVLTAPRSIRPDDDLDQYITERAGTHVAAIRAAVLPETALDLDTAYDVEGDDPDADRDEPPPSGEPAAVYHSAVLARYDWSHTGWDPINGTVAPPAAGGHLPWGRGMDWLRRRAVAAWQGWLGRVAIVAGRAERRRAERRGETLTAAAELGAWADDTTMWIPPLRVVARVAAPLVAGPPERPTGDYMPRHGFGEVPPSIAAPLALMDPVARARELVRQLGQADWWPWADGVDRRCRLRMRAGAIARRHGIPMLLGRFRIAGELP